MTGPNEMRTSVSRRAFLAASALTIAGAACGDAVGTADRTPRGPSSSAPPTPPTTVSSRTAAPPGPSRFVVSGPQSAPRVALTFHTDGDLTLAAQLLDTLAARKVAMTSFVVGQWLDANPTWAQRLEDAGHELANHTYTHPSFGNLSPSAMIDEVVRCRDVLARLTGSGGRLFRPSGTADGTSTPSAQVLATAGQVGYPTVVGFDVDPLDYQSPGPATVVQRTLAAVRPGSVISLHFGYPGTIAALPAILDGLDQRGLTPVTVSKLLA